MKSKSSEYSGRVALAAIVVPHIFIRSVIAMMPSALMSVIMADMGIGYSEAGMLAYIVTIMMGVFLFVGSSVISKLGAVRALAIAMACFGMDGVISFITRNYLLMVLGRALSGIGYGFTIGATSALIAAWFDKRHYSVANSVSGVINSFSLAAAFGVIVPVYNIIGSWQGEAVFWSGLAIACCLLLLIWGRGKTDKTVAAGECQRPAYSLIRAMKYKEVWYLTIAMAGSMWVSTSLMTYLPTHLAQTYGMPIEHASFAAGIISLAGMAGSLFAGFLFRRVENKKVLLNIPVVIALCSSVCIALLPPGTLLYICIFCFGFSNTGWCTISSTYLMGLEGVTPAILSGLMAIMLGTGSLLAFFAPFLFETLKETAGMQMTLLLFALMSVPSLFSMLLFPSKRYMHVDIKSFKQQNL